MTGSPIPPFLQLWKSSRTLRWGITIGATLSVAVALVLMFLLAQATGNRDAYERNYEWLLLVNLVVGFLLFLVIGWMGWRVWSRFRRGKFGSRLLLKLVAVFVLVASVPGALIYLVSYQFVSRSIESWFDVRVERALDAGLTLGRNVLDTLTSEAGSKAQAVAQQLGSIPVFGLTLTLDQYRLQHNAEHLVLWSPQGERIASASASQFSQPSRAPSAEILAQLRTGGVVAQMEGVEEAMESLAANPSLSAENAPVARIQSYALVRPSQFGLQDQAWVLQMVQAVPTDLLRNAIVVQETNRQYQERALARQSMQRMFLGTLTLTLILAVFAAVLLAALLATQLARPLLMLAEGVKQVAEGNLGPKPIYEGHDELGRLTHAFADMTQQLADTRQALTSSVAQLDASRTELQTILDNLSTGVMVLRSDGTVVSVNPAASRILGQSPQQLMDFKLQEQPELAQLARTVQQQFDAMLEQASEHLMAPAAPAITLSATDNPVLEEDERYRSRTTDVYWQQTLELNPAAHEGMQHDVVTLVLRGALLPYAAMPDARLLVFEDISAVVSAQRAQAWGEVARRLAHEIKNPLTPIQLSAERLELKLMDALPEREQGVLAKSVRTIVQQVDAMKRLVNEFRDYARLPAAQLQPLDLNALIADVLQLYGSETATVPVESRLDPTCRPVLADPAQLRQVIHNLLQNAQDAQEQAGRTGQPVCIETQWRPATARVKLSVLDNGTGFPDHILQRAFEPYVTTKAKGTGLGLAVVKKIADDHHARMTIANRTQDGQVMGAQVSMLFPALEQGDGTNTA